MIELIVILCLVWNTVYLINRQGSYVSSGWENYAGEWFYSRGEGKDAWGQGVFLIIPKTQSFNTIAKVEVTE